MFVPRHFAETDWERQCAHIRANPFGILVTHEGGHTEANHVPVLLDAKRRTLCAHLAAANPQIRHLETASEVLVISPGPHAYVSPTLYATPGVPTWNYAAVHVYGRPELIHTEDALRDLVDSLTRAHESGREHPWTPAYDPDLLHGIVGLRIHVTGVQGKMKLSQNRPEPDRRNVARVLSESRRQDEREVGRLMGERED